MSELLLICLVAFKGIHLVKEFANKIIMLSRLSPPQTVYSIGVSNSFDIVAEI